MPFVSPGVYWRELDYSDYVPALATSVLGLVGALGPMVAGTVLHLLEGHSWSIGPFTLIGFHAIFLASFVFRLAATLLIRRVHEPSAMTRAGQ